MKLIAMLLLTCAPLLCALHMLFAATAWPRWLERVTHGLGGDDPATRRAGRAAYVALAMLGYRLLSYQGTMSALEFLPATLGRFQDGEWIPLSAGLASIVALLIGVGVPLALTKLAGFNAAEARRAEAAERRRLNDPD